MYKKIYEYVNYNIDAYFESTIIFNYQNRYVYMHDDYERLKSIHKLPTFLKEEWMKRNTFDVDIKLLESLKRKDKDELKQKILIELIRELKLNSILSSGI